MASEAQTPCTQHMGTRAITYMTADPPRGLRLSAQALPAPCPQHSHLPLPGLLHPTSAHRDRAGVHGSHLAPRSYCRHSTGLRSMSAPPTQRPRSSSDSVGALGLRQNPAQKRDTCANKTSSRHRCPPAEPPPVLEESFSSLCSCASRPGHSCSLTAGSRHRSRLPPRGVDLRAHQQASPSRTLPFLLRPPTPCRRAG